MNDANDHILNSSKARALLLFDANVISYAEEGYLKTGYHLLDYMETIKGTVDWFVGSRVAMDLYNHKIVPGILRNILNCDYPDMKMDYFPYIKTDGNLGFVKLNKISGDDWSQICLAYNYEKLVIVTNDSRMFKSAHAVLGGRAIAFHDFLDKISPYWEDDDGWQKLKEWLIKNKLPLRNNSSWILPSDAAPIDMPRLANR